MQKYIQPLPKGVTSIENLDDARNDKNGQQNFKEIGFEKFLLCHVF